MALSVGTHLGPYEILAPIGAGGMGEVYRAHDPRLRRDVAIKVAAERFTERFEHEARAAAALNHPNICQIYDVGSDYIVMELVEGESPKGPLPLETALNYAHQIAEALEAAHDKGIVHRDLKPGNIKVTPEGKIKVLDFGLAKLPPVEPSTTTENSPTVSMGATQAGLILGTAAYMSPEQARGKRVDKRADIWAFGVVLFELLTGRRPFQGEDLTDTLASVVKDQPPIDQAPAQVHRLLRKCLEKDPKKRLRDVGDAWELLEEPPLPLAAPNQQRRAWPLIAAAFFAIVAAGLGWIAWRETRPKEHPLVRLDVDLGPGVSLPSNSTTSSVILSPDGTRLAYVAVSGGAQKLFTRRLDQEKAMELPGTEGARDPFFSPDGLWIGFYNGRVSKISVEGGAVVPLADVTGFAGAWWGEDGNIIASDILGRGLVQIPSGGGSPTVVEKLASSGLGMEYPQVLPGNKAILFTDFSNLDPNNASIDVLTFANGRRKTVAQGGVAARYLPTSERSGHLLYSNRGTVFAVPFDLDTLATRGTPVPVLYDVLYSGGSAAAHFDFSPTGSLVYRKSSGATSAMTTVQWIDNTGKQQPLLNKPGVYLSPRLSPDGKRLAVAVVEGSSQDIWVFDQQRDAITKLTFGDGIYDAPVWSPDGRFVVFASIGKGMFWARADGGGQPQPLMLSKVLQLPWSFPRDGKGLAYMEVSSGPARIWTVPINQEGGQPKAGKAERFINSPLLNMFPSFSSDGHWLSYVSNSTGTNEVYVRAFPDNGSLRQISNNGGTDPHWSPNGRDLLYRSGDQIMAVSYTAKGDVFMYEKPRVWIAKFGGAQWDLDSSGNRVAEIKPVDAPDSPKAVHTFVLLQNFFDELRRRVPLGR